MSSEKEPQATTLTPRQYFDSVIAASFFGGNQTPEFVGYYEIKDTADGINFVRGLADFSSEQEINPEAENVLSLTAIAECIRIISRDKHLGSLGYSSTFPQPRISDERTRMWGTVKQFFDLEAKADAKLAG